MQNREYQSDELLPDQPASQLASPWSRLAAVIIDTLVVGAPGLIFWVLTFASLISEEYEASLGIGLAVLIIVIFIVQIVLLGTRGQAIGKVVMKIRIVDAQTGAHPGWARLILLRTIVNWLLRIIIPPFYGLVDALFIFRADHRTIHDLYSGTRVDKLTS